MKLAIIGSSPIALEACLVFHEHESHFTWFNADPWIVPLFNTSDLTWKDATSEQGWRLLKETGMIEQERGEFSWDKWERYYYLPLLEIMKSWQTIKPHKVICVAKRFLATQEEIKGMSRFHDLFRIIYQLNPEEFINLQKDSDPETFQRLSDEFIQSLQSSLEMYEDFDLVIDLRQARESLSLNITGRALGEGRISPDKIHYGLKALIRSALYRPGPDIREICLIGSGDMAANILMNLKTWLLDKGSRLFIVSHDENPFEEFLARATPSAKKDLQTIMQTMDEEFQQDVEDFQKKLRDWQELDDFIQVKMPKPVEPIPRLVFFSGHNATAVDQLIDKKRLFVTLEKPDFRRGMRQPENNYLDLKTIGVDEVLVANGLYKEVITHGLRNDEKGFFDISPGRFNTLTSWKEDIDALKKIETEVFKLFSPAVPS